MVKHHDNKYINEAVDALYAQTFLLSDYRARFQQQEGAGDVVEAVDKLLAFARHAVWQLESLSQELSSVPSDGAASGEES